MRQVYKGNVSVPLHIVEKFLAVNSDPKAKVEEMALAAAEMVASLKKAKETIETGLDKSNLTVCIGKFAYVNSHDAKRFLSGEIPRLTIYRTGKEQHSMPLYMKHKPSDYIRRQAIKKNVAKKDKGHGRKANS